MALAYSEPTNEYGEDELNSMTKVELLVLASKLGVEGVSMANLKADIISAILNR